MRNNRDEFGIYTQNIIEEVLSLISKKRMEDNLDITRSIKCVVIFKDDNIHTRCANRVLNGNKNEIMYERQLFWFMSNINTDECNPTHKVTFYSPRLLREVHDNRINEIKYNYTIREKVISATDKELLVGLIVPHEDDLISVESDIEIRFFD